MRSSKQPVAAELVPEEPDHPCLTTTRPDTGHGVVYVPGGARWCAAVRPGCCTFLLYGPSPACPRLQ